MMSYENGPLLNWRLQAALGRVFRVAKPFREVYRRVDVDGGGRRRRRRRRLLAVVVDLQNDVGKPETES